MESDSSPSNRPGSAQVSRCGRAPDAEAGELKGGMANEPTVKPMVKKTTGNIGRGGEAISVGSSAFDGGRN